MKVNSLGLRLSKWMMTHNDKKLKANQELPNVERAFWDTAFDADSRDDQKCDIYLADKPNGITIIDIHGGAYIYSNRKNNAAFAKIWLDKGFNVVLLDYRLNNGKIECHDQLKDLAREIVGVYKLGKCEEPWFDPEKLVLTGDSAGGHFALWLAEAMCDESIAKKAGIDLEGAKVKCVAVNCPVYDLLKIVKDDNMTKGAKKYMLGKRALDLDYQAEIDPRTNINGLRVPVFVSSCRNDFLQEHALFLTQDMDKMGKPIEFMFLKDEDPNVAHVHNVIRLDLDASKRVNDAMEQFFLKNCEK